MVMVSHTHEFIVLKSSKTAGTSVEMALEPLCGPRRAVITEETPARVSKEGIIGRRVLGRPFHVKLAQKLGIGLVTDWNNHMTAAQVRAALGAEKWNRYRKITSIRNPFDRAVSLFHWLDSRRGVVNNNDEDFATIRTRFNEWVARTKPDSNKEILFLDGAFVGDLVIRFEHLQEDLQKTYNLFDPKAGPVQLSHAKDLGSRRKRPVPEYFTEESIAILQDHSGWVIERFGYPDRPLDRKRPAPAA